QLQKRFSRKSAARDRIRIDGARMGATRRAGPGQWQLPLAPRCARKFVARGIIWVAGEPVIWSHILVKSAGTERTRGGLRTNARFAVAERTMDRCLHLQGCAARHGRRTGFPLSTPVHHSIAKGDRSATGIRSTIFRCAFFAVAARKTVAAKPSQQSRENAA